MVDLSSLGEMAALIQNLPEFMFWTQIVIYIFFIFFFGSLALRGYRGYLHWTLHLLLRIGSGFACLVAGIGLSPILPLVSGNMILRIAQLDVVIGGAVSAVVLALSFYIMTLRFPRTLVIKKKIKALEARLSKTRDRPPSKMRMDPLIIIGVVIILAFMAASIYNFRGFPDPASDLLAQMGMTPEELTQIGGLLGDPGAGAGIGGLVPEGVVIEGGSISEQSPACLSAMLAMVPIQDQLQDPVFLLEHMYADPGMQALIEAGSGKTVTQMFRVTEDGNDIIIAQTQDMFTCTAVPGEFCLCAGLDS
jgi:hypothetical protein